MVSCIKDIWIAFEKKKVFRYEITFFRNIVVIIKLNQLMEYLPIYRLVLGMYLEVLQCVYPHLPP